MSTMNEMNPRAVVGNNNPPDPMDEALTPFGDAISEAENWLDGEPVTNESQMKAVDKLAKDIRSARRALDDAKKSATAPLHDAWKAEIARWKPTEDDLDRIQKGLASISNDFKKKLAAERAAEERATRIAAEEAARVAREAAMKADDGNIEEQRQAAAAQTAAEQAQRDARAASKANDVKGLRTVTRYEITDHRALLNWIARNARDDITAFIEEWARRNHKTYRNADGLRVWDEKEAN
ncbi:hypothetical protein CG51_06055 [Haematobacter missouriensis]|uniref:Uncharacterized protein n=2 Tax=Haematobacter missouriensis TaxID=366616 RepID=A0ABX3ZQQ2_9RHOB|nr:hypothetical protein CG51_06055 [Haematobacter missouriensis]OWJ73915.1 hypothetical protein CDV53_14395 [Haematobacter missouriensis]